MARLTHPKLLVWGNYIGGDGNKGVGISRLMSFSLFP